MTNFKNIFKEPLLHFLILGGLLFVLFMWLNPTSLEQNEKKESIVVDATQIEYISNRFFKRYGRVPTAKELKSRIDDYIATEVYYKEALKLNLDKNDHTIKTLMRKKLEQISKNSLSLLDINDEVLQKYLDLHSKKFINDARYAFYQIHIDSKKHEDNLHDYLNNIKIKLEQNIEVKSDSNILPKAFNGISKTVLDGDSGKKFSLQLDAAKLNSWVGPLYSEFGLHFVKVIKRTSVSLAKLKEIRNLVLREYINDRQEEMLKQQLNDFLKNYEIKVNTK